MWADVITVQPSEASGVIGPVATLARVAPALLDVRLANLADAVRPGDLIAGKYRIERVIAEGGMGVIARALHLDLERPVAIKIVRSELSEREDMVARLMLEARAVARLRSEHVARVLDVGRLESGGPFIVMEYLEGKDLWTILHEKGRIAAPLAIDYVVQACVALAEAHALGIVHRDIKPENLFLADCPDGAAIVKLLDFGISKQSTLRVDGGITGVATAVGSPHYMAPEQVRAEPDIDVRADIWAIGVILYELVSGISPFDAESLPRVCMRVVDEQPIRLSEIDEQMPKFLDATIFRCLEKDRARRPANVAEVAAAIAPFGTPETPQRAARIARIVRGSEAGAKGREDSAGSRTPSIGDVAMSDAPTSLMPVAESLLRCCSGQPKPARRPTRRIAVVGSAALCAGIAAGVFFVARPPLPVVAQVSPAVAETKPAAAPEQRAPRREPSAAESPLVPSEADPASSSRTVISSVPRHRRRAGGDAMHIPANGVPGKASLARIVSTASALNRSKVSATIVSERVGSDLAKRDPAPGGTSVAKFSSEEAPTGPNAWDPKNFGGRR